MTTSEKIIDQLKNKLTSYNADPKVDQVGTVLEVGDGVARISGLRQVASMEMLDFGQGITGVALNLEERTVGAIILSDYQKVKQGDIVKATGKILSVPVGEANIGRVLSALGEPKDGKGAIAAE